MRYFLAAQTPVVVCLLSLASSAWGQSAKHPADLSDKEAAAPDPDGPADAAPVADAPAPTAPPAAAKPPPAKPATTKPATKPAKSPPAAKPKTPDRKKGSKAPRKPGSAAAAPDVAARLSVTGGLPPVDPNAVEPAELAALRELDRALFPELGPGASPWVLDRPVDDGSPRTISNGLPPPTVLAPVHPPEPAAELDWLRGLAMPDIPVRWDSRVVRYLDFYKNTPRGRSMITVWVQKSGRYEAKIRQALRQNNLPEDIVWLALMESGFNPDIRSSAGAVGLWQFTDKAAGAYGLRIDRWVDERLDPERSTQAAIRYLSDLHTRFGRWELAFAAYNMGYGGLLTSIRKYNTNDYWELSRYEAGLPYETALYVPKIVAMAIVANNKDAFGVGKVQPEAPMAFDEVAIGAGITFETIAKAAGTEVEKIAKLNPHFLGDRTPPALSDKDNSSWVIRLPAGAAEKVKDALPRDTPLDRTLDRVLVRWGESVDDLASDRGLTAAKLRQVAGLAAGDLVRPGDVLLVPRRNQAKAEGGREPRPVVVPVNDAPDGDRRRVFYKVAWGDTASGVAQALGVSVPDLCRWNALDTAAKLQSEMILQAFVPSGASLSKVRLLGDGEVRVLVQGSEEFFAYFEDQKGRRRIQVVARAGDTWDKIAKRYGITLGMLERINHRSRRSELAEGDRLVIYVDRDRAPKDVATDQAESTDEGRETPGTETGSAPGAAASDR